MSDDLSSDTVTAKLRRGKIGQLPSRVRLELNKRLSEGGTGPAILPWINGLPEVRAILSRDFGGADISPENLSQWREGGYKDWVRAQERIDNIRKLSEMSFQLAKAAGGNMAEGAVAVAGGRIAEVLERVADLPFAVEKGDPNPSLSGVIDSLVALRGSEIDTHKVQIERIKLEQKSEQLSFEKQKWQRQTLDLFFKYYEDRNAREIMESGAGKTVKMERIAELMFGANPLAS